MSERRNAELALEAAVDRFGIDALVRSERGANLVADVVGGSGPDLYRWSRALEIALQARPSASLTDQRRIAETVATEGTAEGIDMETAIWAARVWGEVVVAATPETPTLTAAPTEDEPADTDSTNLLPLLAVVVLVIVLLGVLLVL